MLFGQVALVLGLQVVAPSDGKLPRLAGFFQDADRLGVRHPAKRIVQHILQPRKQVLVDSLLEELHVFGAAFERVLDDALEKRLGERHVVLQIEEGHLRLDHPELGQMARRVGVLRAKRRAKGVDLAQRAGKTLDLQLAADRQVRRLAEKILGVIDMALNAAAASRDRAS